ncbi:hypothetical protein [Phyllobacterium bourgognense]|uniref:hypothetical protein n=1 Tax=Phyllobacterium bourgognense TaxID=314236 RepID=UPI000DF11914|nr:hypothetical protein [Phyllobacterium bourgognense]
MSNSCSIPEALEGFEQVIDEGEDDAHPGKGEARGAAQLRARAPHRRPLTAAVRDLGRADMICSFGVACAEAKCSWSSTT